MSKIEYVPLPPMYPDLTPLRCFGVRISGSISSISCNGCNHFELWDREDGLTGPNGSHAAMRRILEHVAQCPKVIPYPAPKVEQLSGPGPCAFLPIPGRDDAYVVVY